MSDVAETVTQETQPELQPRPPHPPVATQSTSEPPSPATAAPAPPTAPQSGATPQPQDDGGLAKLQAQFEQQQQALQALQARAEQAEAAATFATLKGQFEAFKGDGRLSQETYDAMFGNGVEGLDTYVNGRSPLQLLADHLSTQVANQPATNDEPIPGAQGTQSYLSKLIQQRYGVKQDAPTT